MTELKKNHLLQIDIVIRLYQSVPYFASAPHSGKAFSLTEVTVLILGKSLSFFA